ncbi:MAG TPA: glycerol-3-phosphate dehydrogenase [Gemmatimonadaceae bacterium]|nr:glycerol-3-phosphate dehydrogenase [Gemmatimonadaceae bacterium]
MTTAAWLDRHHTLERLGAERFDVLVIGGGITGAGVARDAALRGLRVALVERDDFGAGTSSRSSRLVHGGVRYLEHGQLGLVFEASHERALLLQLAPHLVRPMAFTWPVYRGARLPRWKLGVGLWLYDALARFRNVGRHERLSAAQVLRREPHLRADQLVGGASYWDAGTDDARLTLATALAAAEAGASVANHVAVTALRRSGGRVAGAVVTDRLTGTEHAVSANVVVNATGPWADTILELDGSGGQPAVRGTKGVHLLVPRERVGNTGAVTLVSVVDGRVMFVLPAGAFTIIGTTDTPTTMSPDEVRATQRDVAYLLQSANAAFPDAGLTADDVISAWAGIRPLVASESAGSPASRSREHELTWSASRLLTVTGGKLTTYRAMAADVVDGVVHELRRHAKEVTSHRVPLPGGDLGSLEGERALATTATGDAAVGERLVHAYGSRWRRVWALAAADHALAGRLSPGLPYLKAEVVHAATREMACTLGDVLLRRTHLGFEARDHGESALRATTALLADALHWPLKVRRAQVAAYRAEVRRVFGVENE